MQVSPSAPSALSIRICAAMTVAMGSATNTKLYPLNLRSSKHGVGYCPRTGWQVDTYSATMARSHSTDPAMRSAAENASKKNGILFFFPMMRYLLLLYINDKRGRLRRRRRQ